MNQKITEPTVEAIEAAKSDTNSFGDIYDVYYQPILNFLYRKTLDLHKAEELTSDCFFQVLKNLPKFKYKHPGSFTAWVYKIALNSFRSKIRLKLGHLNVNEDYFLNQPSPDSEVQEFEAAYDRDLATRKILQALKTLKESEQEIISLYYFEGLSYEQIASIISIKEVSLRSRVSRALANLQIAVQQIDN